MCLMDDARRSNIGAKSQVSITHPSRERIQTIKSLWDSRCQQPADASPSAWHGNILAQREKALRQGADRFKDWSMVKEELLR
ncbi:Putative addiction module component CHP02574 family protein [Acidithiobacillus ferrivorans SS3]|jgi:hypothetical protein|uniref:Putative addiction module component CHP02574 family protein n=1 Tax=Acidithiobacillus ferrivorans SS3 TaxID=743299 RepID=G0JN83_9PROT|nr:Putative addiction module component CHP02574 family protein [Acidithiobacillus ferrivorans SS3]MBU2815492.1 addiction module protein [Acidithiobacillus ferruginosus]OFA16760.1 hypothetical protein A4U49_05450 [Acidithiobacillus ferrivorans]